VKLPRDLSGKSLARALERFGYRITRQSGSHLRLSRTVDDQSQHVTIPSHDSLRVGTLSAILSAVARQLEMERERLIEELFEQ
jgi:predicted RNA binding protein YcfA (HicA-like mRNA interferase family)